MNRVLRNFILALVLVVVAFSAGRYFIHRTTPASTTSTTTSTTTTTTTTVPTSTTTATASLTTCRGSGFSGTNVGSEGAAGTGFDIMNLTKVTAGTCVIDGYPLVTLQEAKGVVESVKNLSGTTNFPTSPANVGPRAYTITAGEKISVELRYSDIAVGAETCPSIVQIDIRFVTNDTSVPVTFPYPISPCVLEGVGVSAFYPTSS